jgi:predicted ribosome quality control (RQC) complex YloA/Tae2 family protein
LTAQQESLFDDAETPAVTTTTTNNTTTDTTTATHTDTAAAAIDEETLETYEEFMPILLAQHDGSRDGAYHHDKVSFRELPSFNEAVDEFFAKVEGQKEGLKLLKQKQNAWKKVERVKEHHVSQIVALQGEQDYNRRKAELIETNLDAVELAIQTVNAELAKVCPLSPKYAHILTQHMDTHRNA